MDWLCWVTALQTEVSSIQLHLGIKTVFEWRFVNTTTTRMQWITRQRPLLSNKHDRTGLTEESIDWSSRGDLRWTVNWTYLWTSSSCLHVGSSWTSADSAIQKYCNDKIRWAELQDCCDSLECSQPCLVLLALCVRQCDIKSPQPFSYGLWQAVLVVFAGAVQAVTRSRHNTNHRPSHSPLLHSLS